MVLVDPSLHPKASWEFDADIAILTHSTTIAPKYAVPGNHCNVIMMQWVIDSCLSAM